MNIIIYQSSHHGNTKILLDAIAEKYNVELINAAKVKEKDLSDYDVIGFASGITFSNYYPNVLAFAEKSLPENKKVFFIHTAGSPRENHNSTIKAIADKKCCQCLGTYFCKGFDTYGPFKIIGGIAKGHPNDSDIAEALAFYQKLL